jgi:hypothetical protein
MTGNTIRGSVDFLDPEFLHSLGIATATFAYVESMLMQAFFVARHQTQDYSLHPDSVVEIHKSNFSEKIDKVFSELRKKVKDFETSGFPELQEDFHKARKARNFIVHGVWLAGSYPSFYKCSMIDSAGRTIKSEIDLKIILSEATRAEHLMISLKSLLVSEGLYPAVGPKLGPEAIN